MANPKIAIEVLCEQCKQPMDLANEIEILRSVGKYDFAAYVCSEACKKEFLVDFDPFAFVNALREQMAEKRKTSVLP